MSGQVIKEYPVILTKALSKELHVFEYPLKNNDTKDFQGSVFTGRIKPDCQMVELDLSLDINGANYNKLKGRDIAEGMGESGEADDDDNGPTLEKVVYRSDPPADIESIRTRMAVMYRRGDKIYVSPLAGFSTFLPTMDHMERKSTIQDTQSNEETQLRAVNVRMGRPESEVSKGRRDNKYSVWRRKIEGEHWIHCRYNGYDPDTAAAQRYSLTSAMESMQLSDKVEYVNQRRYLDIVAPKTGGVESKSVTSIPSKKISLSLLKSLPVEQQVKILMTNANVMRFSRLVETLRFAGSTDSDVHLCNLLKAVQEVAVLVHACWVVKSDILYPENTYSAHSGVPRDLLVRGRDYILWKFTQNCAITRKEISSVIKLPTEEVTDMLRQIARQQRLTQGDSQRRRKWEFIFDNDREFSRRYPEICENQEKMWEARFQQLCSALRLDHQKVMRDRKRSGRYSSSSDTDHFLPMDCGQRRRRTQSASSTGSGFSPERPRSSGKQYNRSRSTSECQTPTKPVVGMEVTDGTSDHLLPPPPVPPNPNCSSVTFPSPFVEKDMRAFVSDKLANRVMVLLSEISHPYRLHLPRLGLTGILDNDRLDELLVEAALREGGFELPVKWPNGAQKDRLLGPKAFIVEEQMQSVRDCLLHLFTEFPGITFAQFRQKVKEETGTCPDDTNLRRILKIYCNFKGKCYYLKWAKMDGE